MQSEGIIFLQENTKEIMEAIICLPASLTGCPFVNPWFITYPYLMKKRDLRKIKIKLSGVLQKFGDLLTRWLFLFQPDLNLFNELFYLHNVLRHLKGSCCVNGVTSVQDNETVLSKLF